MSQFICALLTYSVICCSLAKSNEFVTSSEFVKKQSENKSLANIVRNKNSSKSYLNSVVSGNEKFDRLDKQSRASDQRSESKDKSTIFFWKLFFIPFELQVEFRIDVQVLVVADPNTVLIHRCDPIRTTVESLWKTIDIRLNSTNVYQSTGIFFFFFFLNAINLTKSSSLTSKEYPDTIGKLKDHQQEARKDQEVYFTKEV